MTNLEKKKKIIFCRVSHTKRKRAENLLRPSSSNMDVIIVTLHFAILFTWITAVVVHTYHTLSFYYIGMSCIICHVVGWLLVDNKFWNKRAISLTWLCSLVLQSSSANITRCLLYFHLLIINVRLAQIGTQVNNM